ncbi:hypothetical protein [Gordonia sp. FQ]|uniref:hypothetical protein n=1 Tax=Gordonia sp. FQ TaxID=3446634 RepID=UPI003F84475E
MAHPNDDTGPYGVSTAVTEPANPHHPTGLTPWEASLAAYPEPAPTYCGLPLLRSGEYDVLTAAWLAAFGLDRIHLVRSEDYFADRTTLAGI